MRAWCLLAICLLIGSADARAESISFELYELVGKTGRTLIAEGTAQYAVRDVVVSEIGSGSERWWAKELPLGIGFSVGASIFRENDLVGFGLWLKDRSTFMGRISSGGFSWDWFNRESEGVYRKLQGPGRVRVTLVASQPFQEIAAVEFLEDITLRVQSRPWFLFFSLIEIHIIWWSSVEVFYDLHPNPRVESDAIHAAGAAYARLTRTR